MSLDGKNMGICSYLQNIHTYFQVSMSPKIFIFSSCVALFSKRPTTQRKKPYLSLQSSTRFCEGHFGLLVFHTYTPSCNVNTLHPLMPLVNNFGPSNQQEGLGCQNRPQVNQPKILSSTYTFAYLNLENLMFMYNIYIVSIVQKQNKSEQGSCGSLYTKATIKRYILHVLCCIQLQQNIRKTMKGAKHIYTKNKGDMILNHKVWQCVKYGSTLTTMF